MIYGNQNISRCLHNNAQTVQNTMFSIMYLNIAINAIMWTNYCQFSDMYLCSLAPMYKVKVKYS